MIDVAKFMLDHPHTSLEFKSYMDTIEIVMRTNDPRPGKSKALRKMVTRKELENISTYLLERTVDEMERDMFG